MDFKQIEAFVNVVRFKSFSRAADATFFTQPTISTHISSLEKELNTKLLDRKGRTVEMTPQGQKFYQYAVEMVNARAQAIEALDSGDDNLDGVLELQTSTVPGIAFLPEIVRKFSEVHPFTQFYIEMNDSKATVESLIERRGEIGFVGEYVAEPGIEVNEIFTDRPVLLVPGSYDTDKDTIMMDELSKLPFIWRENGSATRKSFEDTAASRGYDKNNFRVMSRTNDLNLIMRLVANDVGVSILSERTVGRIVKGDEFKVLKIEGFDKLRSFYMITLKNVFLSPVAEAFRKFVLEHADKH